MKAMTRGLFILIFLFSSSWMGDGFLTAENTTIESKQHIIAELTCQAPPHCPESGEVIGKPDPVYKNYFGGNEEIWVTVKSKYGSNDYSGKEARIHIIYHKPKDQWNNGTRLEDVSGGPEPTRSNPAVTKTTLFKFGKNLLKERRDMMWL